MGDFGPAYMSSSRPTAQLYRCDDCSVTMPAAAASDDALCPSCGGTLRSLGVGSAAPPDASARTGVRGTGVSAAEMASVVLSEILSPGLLESLGAAGETSRPTDQTVIAELPRLRIEPYAQLLVRSGAGAATATATATAAATDGGGGAAAADDGATAAPPPLLQLQGTGSSFGTPLSDVRGPLVLSEPLDGSADLVGEYTGRIVLMWRGGCSFTDKVRARVRVRVRVRV